MLRRAGYDVNTQVLALLHDVVEDTPRTIDDVRDVFGKPMADMVGALTEDPSIKRYAQRKRDLRARTVGAGSPVVDLSLADKISSLRNAVSTHSRLSDRKLRHYTITLQLALTACLAPALASSSTSCSPRSRPSAPDVAQVELVGAPGPPQGQAPAAGRRQVDARRSRAAHHDARTGGRRDAGPPCAARGCAGPRAVSRCGARPTGSCSRGP